MSRKFRFVFVLCLALLAALSAAAVMAQGPRPELAGGAQANPGTGFTYQGQLKTAGSPVNGSCDIAFHLFDAATSGSPIGVALTQTVPITNGVFSTLLDFGKGAFTGDARWLDMRVRCPAGSGAFTALTPRQALTPVPIALTLPGVRTEQGLTTTNIIAGFSGNQVGGSAIGATIAGGGGAFLTNTVTGTFGTVGGGAFNRALGDNATVAGGGGNTAFAESATIGGGYLNATRGVRSTIAGGEQNFVTGNWATVSGGAANQAAGVGATVPGGLYNAASGDFSFAAGLNATANLSGTFVWADATTTSYASTAPNQFDIRATNGLSLSLNAGYTKTVKIGERYRDNALVAWAKIDGPTGDIQNGGAAAFGILKTFHISTGEYGITTTVTADSSFDLIPMAIAEIDGVPINAAGMRIVSVNQINPNYFEVYINNGTGTLTDNDFVVMVTAR